MKFENMSKEELIQAIKSQHDDMEKLSELKSDIKWLEDSLKKRTRELNERVKELECLYGISRLVESGGPLLAELFQHIVDLLPSAWQYPEFACARIVYLGRAFQSKPFRETAWRQSSDIVVGEKKTGTVEVFYMKELPKVQEGPFLLAERKLIDCVAERLAEIILSRKFV